MGKNKGYNYIKQWLPVLLLLVYPMRNISTGIDLMDAGYALGNYRYFDSLNQMWKLATYLANITGTALSKLPWGDSWIGMNGYTAVMLGLVAAGVFWILRRRMQHPVLLWLGELLALSLCWAPTTILYHYLGYYAITAATLVLYQALMKKNKKYYVIAGMILGLAVGVRMPNITYVALIIPVWYYEWLTHNKNWIQDTLTCIAGFTVGLLIPLGVITVQYGIDAYPEMISSLFGITDTATDYKPTAMLLAMFGDYIRYSVWLILFGIYLVGGLFLFHIARERFIHVKRIVYLAGMAVLLRLCYGRGMFGLDYTSYFAVYKWVTVYLLIVILLCIYYIITPKAAIEQKLWAAFMLIIILVTPLGSNNGLYPLINNLFLIAPVSFVLLYQVIEEQVKKDKFVWRSITALIIGAALFQSILFGIFFHFHDALPAKEQYVKTDIPGSSSTRGMYTTVDKKEKLEALGGYLTQNHLTDKKVLLYGEIPAISYIFDMEPAIFTTWADLPSNALDRLETELAQITGDYPVVIVTDVIGQQLQNVSDDRDAKLQTIAEFLQRGKYQCTYAQKGYYVYVGDDTEQLAK